MAQFIHGNFKNQGNEVIFNVPVIRFTEENIYFYYTPAFDIAGYGNTDEEAKNSFEETITQFLDYSTNKNTFFNELKKLGWKLSKKVSRPPSLVEMITRNDYLARIFEEKTYQKFDREVKIPAFA